MRRADYPSPEGVDRDRFRRISEALGPRHPPWQVTRKRRSRPKPRHERLADRLLDALDNSVWMLVCAGGLLLLALAWREFLP